MDLVARSPNLRRYFRYTNPSDRDRAAAAFDGKDLLTAEKLQSFLPIDDYECYLCGPTPFMTEVKEALASLGVTPERIQVELFNGSEPLTPGVVGAATPAPHPPGDDADTGPLVSFARSGVAAGTIPSRNGNAKAVPIPRSTVRRGIAFFVMIMTRTCSTERVDY